MKKHIVALLLIGFLVLPACVRKKPAKIAPQHDKNAQKKATEQSHENTTKENIVSFQGNFLAAETKRDVKLEKAIKEFIGYDKNKMGEIKYLYNRVDLNGDKENEVFVMLVGPDTDRNDKCNMILFQDSNDGYIPLWDSYLINSPIIISEKTTNGWKDIIVAYGESKAQYAVLEYSDGKYPDKPPTQSEIKPGTTIKGTAILSSDIKKAIKLR